VRALLLDFNGTISEDEPILYRIFEELFAEAGRPITEAEYYDQLAGHSDREVIGMWLGHEDAALEHRKIERYRELAADGSTVSAEAREAIREAADRGILAVVSGAARAEIDLVLQGAGIEDAFTVVVAMDDVRRGKPDPEGYLIALHLLGLTPAEGAAVEDSPAGVAAAKAAGLYTVGVTTTQPAERLSAADDVASRVDRDLIARLLSLG
jgi:HAD superfamily hydrolase (TIGR01509 family)